MFCRALSDSSQVQLLDKLLLSGAFLMVPAKSNAYYRQLILFCYDPWFIIFREYVRILDFNCSSLMWIGRIDTIEFFDPSVHLRIDDTEIQIQDICDLTGDVFETIEISC